MKADENNLTELVSTWSDFGCTYRGKWNPFNEYKVDDVVWVELGPTEYRGSETYFVCKKEHVADESNKPISKDYWG